MITTSVKLIPLIIWTLFAGSLLAVDQPSGLEDPFAKAFFPPEFIFLARDRIAMTEEQKENFRSLVLKASPVSEEMQAKLARENAALAKLTRQERVDRKSVLEQLEKVLDIERALKRLHVGLLADIKNILTKEQQEKLRELAKDGGASLAEEARKRLENKVELVKAGVQRWTANGRDASEMVRAMEERVKPRVEAGNVIGAETELDRLIEQLKENTK